MSDNPPDLDSDVQNSLSELMRDDYRLLLETFMNDAEMRLEHLRLNLDEQNWESFRQTAHSFRGSCGNMGAIALQKSCHLAEQAGTAEDADAARSAYLQLVVLYERVETLLHSLLQKV